MFKQMHSSSKRVLAVIGIGLGVMILAMIWSIVNTALASIQKDLSANVLQLQWMMNCFGIFICTPLLTMGKLGDAYGRKRLFLWGLVLALLASVIAGFAKQIELLIVCMGLFGFSGSAILPLSQALLVHQFPENQKERAVGLWSIFASLSLAIGPLVGGVLVNLLGWRWIYWINVPVILVAIPIVCMFVEKEKEHQKAHCDWAGVVLLALTIGSLIIGIMQGPTWGWDSYLIIGLFAITVLSLSFFIVLEKKSSMPMFRPDLFSNRCFLFSAIPNGCTVGYLWAIFFFIPLYLQNIRSFTPIEAGLMLLIVTLPVVLFSVPVTKGYRKWGAKPLMLAGFILFAFASLLQIFFASKSMFWPIALSCLAIGFGWVLSWGPAISCSLSSLPHNLAGIASGMFTTMQEMGAVTFFAIAGVVFRSTNQRLLQPEMSQITSSLGGYSSDQMESLLTNPVAVQGDLGASSPIVPWLRDAFLGGYQDAYWFLLGLSLLALVLSIFLPKVKAESH